MNFSFGLDHNHKVIHYLHTGNVGKDEIGMAWQVMLGMKEFTEKKYNLLSDYRKSKFNLEVKDVDLITEHLLALTGILKGKKQALLLDEPMSVALSVLFEGEVNDRIGFKVKVFATEEAAMKWLTGDE
ncbi:MAG: hypothetical protein JXR65_00250 [Bacteroidales bacterium]|nr:hypothetical protein [Bacteroidales bacterium]